MKSGSFANFFDTTNIKCIVLNPYMSHMVRLMLRYSRFYLIFEIQCFLLFLHEWVNILLLTSIRGVSDKTEIVL